MKQNNSTFKDVNKEQMLFALCCDASNFTGFPENAKLLLDYIHNNKSNDAKQTAFIIGHSSLFERMTEKLSHEQ